MQELRIGRTRYRVKKVRAFRNSVCTGRIDYGEKTISVATHGGITGRKLSKAEMEQSFWHEVVHGILRDMNHALESNESFVDRVAIRLVRVVEQVYATSERIEPAISKIRMESPRSVASKLRQQGGPAKRSGSKVTKKRPKPSGR